MIKTIENVKFYIERYNRVVYLSLLLIVVFLFNIYVSTCTSSQNPSTNKNYIPPVDIKDGWLYKWGDSPLDKEGIPAWISAGSGDAGWQYKDHREDNSIFNGFKTMWFKTTLPLTSWEDPSILYRTYEQNVEVYLENELIYTFGKINSNESKISFGSPWHIISLPKGYEGKTIYLRVYSHSVIYTSFLRVFKIGSRDDLLLAKSDMILDILRSHIDYVILSGLFIFTGIAMIFLYLIKRIKRTESLSLGLAAICLGLWILAESEIRSLVIDAPIVWTYIAYISIQLVPIGFCEFMRQVFLTEDKLVFRRLSRLYRIYIPIVFLLDFFNLLSLMHTIKIFHAILIVTIIIILWHIVKLIKKGVHNAIVFVVGMSILSFCGIYDIIDRFYFPIPMLKGHHLTQWAMFIFLLTLMYILERHYLEVQDKLQDYSREIEYKNETINESKKLLDHALEYDKLKNEFIANISHELRTPLSILLGTLQLFRLYFDNGVIIDEKDNAIRHIKSMQQNCFRLLRLVNNIIDITKIDSGHMSPSLENCNIVSIIKDITFSVGDYIKSKGVTFEFNTNCDEKVIACDPDKIERIFLNLLSNAVKFTRPGDTISVDIQALENNLKICVGDTGIGIPDDKLHIIFERFRQVDKTLTRSHEGSGIGLSIVRSLVEMHGGNITVESQTGQGTRFFINLPVKVVQSDSMTNKAGTINYNNRVEKINIEFSDIYS